MGTFGYECPAVGEEDLKEEGIRLTTGRRSGPHSQGCARAASIEYEGLAERFLATAVARPESSRLQRVGACRREGLRTPSQQCQRAEIIYESCVGPNDETIRKACVVFRSRLVRVLDADGGHTD